MMITSGVVAIVVTDAVVVTVHVVIADAVVVIYCQHICYFCNVEIFNNFQ